MSSDAISAALACAARARGRPLASLRLQPIDEERAGGARFVPEGARDRGGIAVAFGPVRRLARTAPAASALGAVPLAALLAALLVALLAGAPPASAGPAGPAFRLVQAAPAAPTASTSTRSIADLVGDAARYLESRQQPSGGFAEAGRDPEPGLTAWAALGLAAVGRPPRLAADYLAGKPYPTATDLELRILALVALGRDPAVLVRQLEGLRRPTGAIGPTLNSTTWGVLALSAAGRRIPRATVRYLLASQHRSGGWSWRRGLPPDSNDTAATIQALRAAGVPAGARSLRRALAYLLTLQNPDGGFELTAGRGSDAPSTAWAIQALVAAGRDPGRRAVGYLAGLRRPDGSFRYNSRTVSSPVWTTAQVLAALARRPYPIRP